MTDDEKKAYFASEKKTNDMALAMLRFSAEYIMDQTDKPNVSELLISISKFSVYSLEFMAQNFADKSTDLMPAMAANLKAMIFEHLEKVLELRAKQQTEETPAIT